MDVHVGTHVDAPSHFMEDGGPVSTLDLDAFIGPAIVVDASGLDVVQAGDVARLVPADSVRVLFRTDNSVKRRMRSGEFYADFVGLTPDATRALASMPNLKLVGNDYLSIQPYNGDPASHLSLMEAGIAILEGLDLCDIAPGRYDLNAVPLRLDMAEAAPMRVLLGTTAEEEPR
jgi:arylformamidase